KCNIPASALSNRLHSICRCLCVSDAEASDCQLIFHKQVGDTVEFPSCSPPEGVDYPTWNYNKDTVVAENTMTVYPKSMFQDRVELNPKNFSLTVRNLTRQDSGVFSFLSEVNGQQRHTVTITLQVHEPITVPVLTAKTTWNASTASCTVWLECISRSDSNVTYKWAVGNQTLSGRRLTYSIWPLDGGTRFTCNISDSVREESASKTVKCMNATSDAAETGMKNLILFVGVAAGGALMVVIAAVIGVCNCKHRQAGKKLFKHFIMSWISIDSFSRDILFCLICPSNSGGDSNDLTVYADIADVAIVKDVSTVSVLRPCAHCSA
uniref:Ig-like domain-containing protein n=1 Tax=Scophthalmus maximus TaxID=52904 RepID=A0A8D2ZR89_SCOMX